MRAELLASTVALAGFASLSPGAVDAHPHIFIDTGLRVVVDEAGQLEAVEVSWTYDEFYSLLLFEEMALDPDMDGVLTEAALKVLEGFDLNWVEGYAGDTYVSRDGAVLELGPPQPVETRVENGQITTRHRRAVTGPADGVLVQAYDPTFYTAYDLTVGVEVSAETCRADVTPADLDSAYAALEEMLFNMPQDQVDRDFPAVGETFADKVVVRCE